MSLILGLESSCDESAAAVVENGRTVLASEVASQIARHAPHGGVVPELAAREHLKAMLPVTESALRTAGVTMRDIDAVAVTQVPGLIPALLVGVNFAKGLAMSGHLPLIGVNHFMAHIYGAFLDGDQTLLQDPNTYPMLALVVSGGHTSLLLVNRDGTAHQLGCTLDDAAGEALDKGAKLLGLGYPGGPVMQRTAEGGDPERFNFPRPLIGAAGRPLAKENLYNFSFSGIKTALLYHVRRAGEEALKDPVWLRDTAAGYQRAVVDVLVRKALTAVRNFRVRTVVVAGGVACNAELRRMLAEKMPSGVRLCLAPPKYCTDNAAMVGGIGWHLWRRRQFMPLNMDAFARLPQIVSVPFLGGAAGAKPARLAVFDLDGTLADTLRDLADSANLMRNSFGLPPLELDAVRRCIGGGIRQLVKLALPERGDDLETGVARMKAFYGEHLTDHTRLFPHVASVLERLRAAGVILAVVSNKNSEESRNILARNGALGYFSDLVGGDSEYALKPAPDALIGLRRKYGLSPEECWMVGDHFTDMEAGRRAGFRRIFCSYGFGELCGETPDFTVDSFAEVAEIMLRS